MQASESMSSQQCDATGLNSYVIPAMVRWAKAWDL